MMENLQMTEVIYLGVGLGFFGITYLMIELFDLLLIDP